MTLCPECGDEFETTGQEKELPVQALQQECPSCGYMVRVSILNYPDSTYEVISPALQGDTCNAQIVGSEDSLGTSECGANAMIRQHKIGSVQGARCAEHMGAHRETALDLRSEL